VHLLVVEDDAASAVSSSVFSVRIDTGRDGPYGRDGLEVATSNLELDAIILDVGCPTGPLRRSRTLRKQAPSADPHAHSPRFGHIEWRAWMPAR